MSEQSFFVNKDLLQALRLDERAFLDAYPFIDLAGSPTLVCSSLSIDWMHGMAVTSFKGFYASAERRTPTHCTLCIDRG